MTSLNNNNNNNNNKYYLSDPLISFKELNDGNALLKDINNLDNFMLNNEYSYSTNKVKNINNVIKNPSNNDNTIDNKINILQQESLQLQTRIQNNILEIENLNGYSSSINSILEKDYTKIPNINNKIKKIDAYFDNVGVLSLVITIGSGTIFTYGTTSLTANFTQTLNDNTFVIGIDRQSASTLPNNYLGSCFIFYLSNQSNIKVGNTISNVTQSERNFFINTDFKNWKDHYNNAINMGMNLASIVNMDENNKVVQLLQNTLGHNSTAWTGGIRNFKKGSTATIKTFTNSDLIRGTGNDNNTWRWVNGDSFNFNNWNAGEPNDCCGSVENYIQLYGFNSKWNDLGDNGGYLPAIYIQIINRYTTRDSITPLSNTQITSASFNASNISSSAQLTPQLINNDNLIYNINNVGSNISDMINILQQDINYYNTKYTNNSNLLVQLNQLKTNLNNEINNTNYLNSNYIPNPNMSTQIESFTNLRENFELPFYDIYSNDYNNTLNDINIKLSNLDDLRREEHEKLMYELITQQDNVLTNTMLDYMIYDPSNNHDPKMIYSNLNKDYETKLRKIKINNYNAKIYKEYINILKNIIYIIIITLPIFYLNKLKFINNKITIAIISGLVIIAFIYILYKIYYLYYRDNIDYDVTTIPFNIKNIKSNIYNKVKNDKDINIVPPNIGTCIEEQCCDPETMYYDTNKRKCEPFPLNLNNFPGTTS